MNVFSARFHLTEHRVVVTTNQCTCTCALQARYALHIPLSNVAMQNRYSIVYTPTECFLVKTCVVGYSIHVIVFFTHTNSNIL